MKTRVTVEALVQAPVEKVWDFWTRSEHIVNWNFASDDWHCPWAKNDAQPGGKFVWRMEAKDGSFGFDFNGEYQTVSPHQLIEYAIEDGRKVKIVFTQEGTQTRVTETFEAEDQNPVELQKGGWQAILNNFKKYVEASGKFERLQFEILIQASPEKVYACMLDEKLYSEWTKAFDPNSRFLGTWEKGSEIRFMGTEKDGNAGGMISLVEENIPNSYVSLLHLGMIMNGKDITDGPEIDEWAGAHENYTFEKHGDDTLLKIELDSVPAFKSYFAETYPKALDSLKTICEQ
ncbi:SRPBCC family protein [Maribellus sp. YY47]|uniref:SRPBCC family protein n=1 Tax=Maribellus sp. YY47 TaxID=2929486 RepID=UPI002000CF56|nr:SRPBCC family protein [Maribellus sp. YY47]MCK3685270.1 SRPBCC domain-containing protein [Maribellus sp. YY47]